MLQKVQEQLQHQRGPSTSHHHSSRRHSPQSAAAAPLKSAMAKGSSGSSSGESSAATTPSAKKKSLHFDTSVVTIPPSPPVTNGVSPPPPPPPPPPPMMDEEFQLELLARGGKAVTLDEDRDRARTIRIGEVVWPPRKSPGQREGNVPQRNIGEVVKGARPGVHKVSVEELQQRAQNLRQVTKAPKVRPQSYPGPRVKVAPKVIATPPPLATPAFVKGHKRASSFDKPLDVHQEAMQKIRAQQKILGNGPSSSNPSPPPPHFPSPRSPSPQSPVPSMPLPRSPPPPTSPVFFPPPPTEEELAAARQQQVVIHQDTTRVAGRPMKEAKRVAMEAQSHSEALTILKSKGIQMERVTSSPSQVRFVYDLGGNVLGHLGILYLIITYITINGIFTL